MSGPATTNGKATDHTPAATRRAAAERPAKLRNAKSDRPTVEIRPEDKDRFVEASSRAGLPQIDAMTLAVKLLEKAVAGERPETVEQRIARLAGEHDNAPTDEGDGS